MANSRFVQLTPYALLEYEYSVISYSSNNQGILRLTDTTNNVVQFMNVNNSLPVTGNVMDRSAFNILSDRWVHLDIDRAVPYIDTVEFLVVENLIDVTDTPFNIRYDRVKVHLLSGYNLEDIDGFIVKISFPENSGNSAIASTQTFLKGDSFVVFNPRPILLGERTYDRYIEYLVPALDWLTTEFISNPDNPSGELAYYLSSDHNGFLIDGLIDIAFLEISETKIDNGQLILFTDQAYDLKLNQADRFDKLSTVIRESDSGDYFEYYPTWDGGFVSDYIANLNSVGGDYAVLHDLRIYAQVAFSQIEEHSFTSFQDSGFDKPNIFRPIILNADAAYAFSIDYTMHLYDKNGNIQIIRRASVTSEQPKKYGKRIERIELQTSLQSYKVYNKIVDGATFTLPQITNVSKVETVYVPTFYQMNNIAVSSETVIIDANADVTSEKFLDSSYIFGQGDAIILLSPFDNYVKFRLYRALGRTQTPEPMDLSHSMDVQLVFIDDTGVKRRFNRIRTQSDIKPESGDLLFRVPSSDSVNILDFTSNKFYITTQAEIINDNNPVDEVPLYTGVFLPYDQIDEALIKINSLKDDRLLQKAQDLRIKEAQLNTLNSSLLDKQTMLDQRDQQLTSIQQQQDLVKQQLSSQQLSLDVKSKLVDDQTALLKTREDDIRTFIKSTQEQENLALSQFQALLASLDSRLNSTTNTTTDITTSDTSENIPISSLVLERNNTQVSKIGIIGSPVQPIKTSDILNVPEIPGKYGTDLSISSRFASVPISGISNVNNFNKGTLSPTEVNKSNNNNFVSSVRNGIVLTGTENPPKNLGNTNDSYVNQTTGDVWVKDSIGWTYQTTIKGTDVNQLFLDIGRVIIGSGIPNSSTGQLKDVYVDNQTFSIYKKTNSGWNKPVAVAINNA